MNVINTKYQSNEASGRTQGLAPANTMETINSIQNNRIKNVVRLSSKSKERREQGLFVLEGARELSLALTGGYRLRSVFICRELFAKTDYPDILSQVDPSIVSEVTLPVFEKMAYRDRSDGVIVLAETRMHKIDDLPLTETPFYIIIETIEKPGNLGAILRTADAAKVSGIIVCDPSTDIYNPNVIRSSVGCLFTVPVAICTSQEALDWLTKHSIRSYAAELTASEWYHEADFTHSSAVVMGTEADGLSAFWLHHADCRIKIPMRGEIDSLNVSVSTAVIVFEAMRQRGFER